MGGRVLSEHLLKFIQSNIQTVWALEVLLIMCRNQNRDWTPDDMNRELRGSVELVHAVLIKFEQVGLAKRIGDRYHWAPSTPELQQLAEELVAKYSTHSLTVIKAITGAQVARIQTLADAFKINKDEQ